MSDALPGIIAQMRRLYHHMLSGVHITPPDLGRQIEALEKAQTSVGGILAAIQTHHDTKHGRAGGRSAAVLVAGDRALYEAAGVKHAVLGVDEGALDEVRRAPARALRPAAQKIADGLNEVLDYVNIAAIHEPTVATHQTIADLKENKDV